MVKLDGILNFVTIAEAGSISAAAVRLHLSKSVVSERLAELERSLGAPLIHRTTRKLSLTEDGIAFLEKASGILFDVREAVAEVAERRGTLSGSMRLSAPVTFGRMHLGPALYPFLSRHPGIALTLDLDDRRVDAAADGYDAVIRHGAVADSRLVALPLAPSRRILVAAPGYLDLYGVPVSLACLAAHRAVYYTNRNVADWRFAGLPSEGFVRPPAALRVNNGDVMRDAVVAGLGLALLPSFIVGQDVKDGRLARIDIGIEAEEEMVYVAHSEGRRTSRKLQELVVALRGAFGSPPYWDVG